MEAYFFASPSLLKPLQKIQNDALRLCTGALVSIPVICLHHACNEMPLNSKHKFLCLKFNLTNEGVENYNVVVARFNTYFNVRMNVFYERALFNRLL